MNQMQFANNQKVAALNVVVMDISDRADLTLKYAQPTIF